MIQVFYSNDSGEHSVYVDQPTKQTIILLPPTISEEEARQAVYSPASKYIIEALLEAVD